MCPWRWDDNLSYHFSWVVHLSWPRTRQVGQAGWAVNPRNLAVPPYHQDYRHTHSTLVFFFFFLNEGSGDQTQVFSTIYTELSPRAKICPTSPYCSVGIKPKLSCLACDLPGSSLLAHYRGSLHTLHTDTHPHTEYIKPRGANNKKSYLQQIREYKWNWDTKSKKRQTNLCSRKSEVMEDWF